MSQYLHKNTMAEMRALTSTEIAAVLDNTYVGVMLHGYYAYGDTPAAITYYKSSTTLADDQGSVIVINPSLKLEHRFSICDVAYYGLQTDTNSAMVADRNTLVINNALKIAPKVVITQPGKYWCRGNRGGEGGSYYRYEGDPLGTTWWQVGDGDGSPGGINMLSNRTFEMGDGVTLKMRGTFMDAYNFITVWNKENVTIRGGTIIGDFDLDPDKNEHKRPDGTNDGGQWGYGISLQGSKNVVIENVDISKMWADGINLAPDYIHDFVVNSDITIKNTKSHHNRRQGMSIDGGLRLSIYNSEFSDTKGQDPQAGVDLERDTAHEESQLKDVLFFDCKFLNNHIGALTAQKVQDKLSIKFDSCLFQGNTTIDYGGFTSNGVELTNCRFSHNPDRIGTYSIRLVGAQDHKFDNCEFEDVIQTEERTLGVETFKCRDIYIKNSKSTNIIFPSNYVFPFIDLSNSVNVRIEACNFKSLSLLDDRNLIIANGAENIEILNNNITEIGCAFDFQNVNGFKFNGNTSINALTTTGILRGNIKYFELCDNTISGNSYHNANALAPVFIVFASGNAYGRISDNVLYKDPIFTTIGAINGNCTGLYREYAYASDNIVVANNKTYGFTNANAFQFNAGSTNLSVSYLNQEADTTYKGIVNQSVAISTISTANATDASTTQALVNELKAKINTLITDQKTAGQIKV